MCCVQRASQRGPAAPESAALLSSGQQLPSDSAGQVWGEVAEAECEHWSVVPSSLHCLASRLSVELSGLVLFE